MVAVVEFQCMCGHAMGICARVVGCVGVGGVLHGDMCKGGGVGGCWGGATWGYVQGWWGVGGCYMGICARVVGCGGVGGVLHGDMCKGGGGCGCVGGGTCFVFWFCIVLLIVTHFVLSEG